MATEEKVETGLIKFENTNPVELFTEDAIDALIEQISATARSIVVDTSTAKGRNECISIAGKVARSKTYIDGIGKDYVAQIKAQVDPVDKLRKKWRDALSALKDEVRKPVTDWEDAESERKQKIHDFVKRIRDMVQEPTDGSRLSSEEIQKRIDEVESHSDPDSLEWCEEFTNDAVGAVRETLDTLATKLEIRTKEEKQAAKLKEMEKADRKRKKEEEEKRIKEEAVEAERKRVQKEADDKKAQEEKDEAEKKRKADDAEANKTKAQQAKDAKKAQEKAEVDRVAKIRSDAIADTIEAIGPEVPNADLIAANLIDAVQEGIIRNVSIKY